MMPMPYLSPNNPMGFTTQAIDRLNDYLINKAIKIDSDFYKEYLNIIRKISIKDAKQLIHIYRSWANKPVNFDYQSEDDILIELTTIVSQLQNPTFQLQELFRAKIDYLLPPAIHQWLEDDLSAMLFFVQTMPTTLNSKACIGGDEFKTAFMNFIQFHVIQSNGWETSVFPITFMNEFDKLHWKNQFENYKKWYLSIVTPRKKFNWLDKCDDQQLDNLIDDLTKKGLIILQGVFYPKTKDDKISLIIASLNAILKDDVYQEEFVTSIVQTSYDFSKDYYFLSPVGNYLLLSQLDVSLLGLSKDEYFAIGLDLSYAHRTDIAIYIELEGQHQVYGIPHTKKTLVREGRDTHITRLYNASRQKNDRKSKSIAKEERTVTILRKNMEKLEELAKSQSMTMNQFTNKLIEVAYDSKNSQ